MKDHSTALLALFCVQYLVSKDLVVLAIAFKQFVAFCFDLLVSTPKNIGS